MDNLLQDPNILLYAILGGAVPAVFWLWFWLRNEDKEEPEPLGLIILTFLLGSIMVIIAMYLEKFSAQFTNNNNTAQIIVWASIEELLKLVGVSFVIFGNNIVRKPIDYPMYFIAVALGFAAFENVLYLAKPLNSDGTIVGMLTGNLRFLGSTLLHAIASGLIGSAIGIGKYVGKNKGTFLLIGILCAIALHSVFNFFIMSKDGENFLSVFGLLWVVTIISILIFEKLKRMSYGRRPITTYSNI